MWNNSHWREKRVPTNYIHEKDMPGVSWVLPQFSKCITFQFSQVNSLECENCIINISNGLRVNWKNVVTHTVAELEP